MKKFNSKKAHIIHSLLWAMAMLVGAYFFQGEDFASTLIIFMIGAWYLSNTLFIKSNCKPAACCSNRLCDSQKN